jgi:voltage-gated potassium channel
VVKSGLQDQPRSARRRAVRHATVRSVLTAAVFVVAYYVLPIDQPYSQSVVIELVVGLVVVIGLIGFQAREIANSPYPGMRAVVAMATSLPFFLLLFATVYFQLGRNQPGSFTQVMTRTDALYFTMTVFSSVGFGDIVPKFEIARILTMIQMAGDLLVVGVAARIIVRAVQTGQSRVQSKSGSGQPPSA